MDNRAQIAARHDNSPSATVRNSRISGLLKAMAHQQLDHVERKRVERKRRARTMARSAVKFMGEPSP